MRRFVVVGRTGVGKSSAVNTLFSVRRAATDKFEACTRLVTAYADATPWGDVCVVDTPGLAEADDALDEAYVRLIRRELAARPAEVLYVTRLDDTRFRPEDMAALRRLATAIAPVAWREATLVFTFAASVPAAERTQRYEVRRKQIEAYMGSLGPAYASFRFAHALLLDNVVAGWAPDCLPLGECLAG